MGILIGTMFVGKVDSLGEESIQTKFLVLGLPLLALESIYVTAEVGKGVRGFPLRHLHGRSVAAAYMRWWGWMLGVIGVLLGYVLQRDADVDPTVPWILSFALLFVGLHSTFRFGHLAPADRARRAILKSVTGVGAPAMFVPGVLQEQTRKALHAAWEKARPGIRWEEAAAAPGPFDPLLLCLAEYEFKTDLSRRMVASARDVSVKGWGY